MKASRKIPKRKIKCNQCDRRFSTIFARNLHMHVHQSSNSSWFPCRSCGKKFSKIVSLLKHREIHPPPLRKRIDKRWPAHFRKNSGELALIINEPVVTTDVSFANLGRPVQAPSHVSLFSQDT